MSDTFMLTNLNDEEFADELRESLFDDELWAEFETPANADRTQVSLQKMRLSLDRQIIAYKEERGRDWYKRARGLLLQVHTRQYSLSHTVKLRNRDKTATVAAMERKWSGFAAQLADALADSDMAFMLDEIDKVGHDGESPITARRWLDARREQRARKLEPA